MNHTHLRRSGSSCPVFNTCHPERSLAKSEAARQTESKDPYSYDATAIEKSFRVVVRFFNEQDTEVHHEPSRKAAQECSPRRKPWEAVAPYASPVGAKETSAGRNPQ